MREEAERREREEQVVLEAKHQRKIEREALRLKAEIASLRFELALAPLGAKAKFNPSQPRVPAGNSDGGQWTEGETGSARERDKIHLAASEGLPIGPRAVRKLIFQIVKRAIEAFRSEDILRDLLEG